MVDKVKSNISAPSTAFFGFLAIVAGMLESVPQFVVNLLWVATAISGIWLVSSLIRAIMPKEKLPMSFEVIHHERRSTANPNLSETTFKAEIKSLKVLSGSKINVEYHHKYSRDGREFKKSITFIAELPLSSSGEQIEEVIVALKTKPDFGKGFQLNGIKFILADKTLEGLQIGNFNVIDILFAHPDFITTKKRVWISGRGHIYTSKPEEWPNGE